MNGTKNMTEGRPAPLILTFALPLMAGSVFQQLYTVVDTMVVGRFLGVDALASLGAVDWLNWMMLGVIEGLAQGFAIPMAQAFGAGDMPRLRRAVGSAAVLALALSLALVGLGHGCVGPALTLLHVPARIRPGSELYLRVMFSGLPIVAAYNLLACVFRSLGDGRTPLRAMAAASLANIALDLLFVMGFSWGIGGAAAATLIAQALSCLYCLANLRKLDALRLTGRDLRPDRALSPRLLALGSPMALQNCVIALGGMILTAIVDRFGVPFIAGYTAANKLFGVLEMAAVSYGYSMITYVGQNLGAGRTRRIRRGVRTALVIALATSLLIAAVMLLGGRLFLGGFLSGGPEERAPALDAGYAYLAVMSVCLPALYALHVIRSSLQGMGNTVMPMVSGVMEFCMRTGVALVLSRTIGGPGVFFAEVASWMGADVVLICSYLVSVRRLPPEGQNKSNS